MDGQNPDEDDQQDGEGSPTEQSKSKSPTPEVADSEETGNKSPTPEVVGSNKSKSPTPEVVEPNKSKTSTPALRSRDSVVSVNPNNESIKTKSKSPTPELLTKPSESDSKNKSQNAKKSDGSKKSLTLVHKSRSMVVKVSSVSVVPESALTKRYSYAATDTDKALENPDDQESIPSNTKSTQTYEFPDYFISTSTQTTDETEALSMVASVTTNADSIRPNSRNRSVAREVSFAESYTPSGQESKMSQLRTSILSGGTPNSGSTKLSSKAVIIDTDGRKGSSLRGSSLAVFRSAAAGGFPAFTSGLLQKRSPFIHNPPQPEERRERIAAPRTPREYIINLREDLADFQETHGLPRSRDYSFVSLGLALAQETGRAIYSLFLMFTELIPILAIVSLILRFALDKLIEILETTEPVPKLKKSVIFALEMLAIVIPLWILIGTIIIPLLSLILSIFKRVIHLKGGKKKAAAKGKIKSKPETCSSLLL